MTLREVQTQYYKVAHLHLVTYQIFTAKEAISDQTLLELELQIRQDHPRVLLTYNNKCLYHFTFGHWHTDKGAENQGIQENPAKNEEFVENDISRLDLAQLYPQIALKTEATVSVARLANPAQSMGKGQVKDEYLAYASLLFMKAVKKLLLYNVSASGNMHLFGNYVIGRISRSLSQFRVIQMDPVLLPRGDLLVSITQRNRLCLFESNVVNLDHVIPEFSGCFVIYVIPSGLRCHLYDTQNISQSFTTTPPKSSATLLKLLKASTGTDLTAKSEILWVKLIPNLQHLNNHTSDISRFVHEVDNRKYILWPWQLCVLQFGSVEKQGPALHAGATKEIDPLSLINDFLTHSVSQRAENPKYQALTGSANIGSANAGSALPPSGASGSAPTNEPEHAPTAEFVPENMGSNPATNFPFSMPSALSHNFSGVPEESPDVKASHFSDAGMDQHAPSAGTNANGSTEDLFGLSSENAANPGDPEGTEGKEEAEKPKPEGHSEKADSDDDEDLFGEMSDTELKGIGSVSPLENDPAKDNEDLLKKALVQDTFPNAEQAPPPRESDIPVSQDLNKSQITSELKNTSDIKDAESAPFLEIPKHEMILAEIIQYTPGSYADPGAPPPLVPTPAIPQSGTFANFTAFGHASLQNSPQLAQNPFSQPKRANSVFLQRDRRQLDSASGWAFSPIVFNPKIKSSIDTKYGKGGKFYVEKDDSSGPELEPRKPRLRETSVLAYDLHMSQEDFGTKQAYFRAAQSSPIPADIGDESDHFSGPRHSLRVLGSLQSDPQSLVAHDLAVLSDESENESGADRGHYGVEDENEDLEMEDDEYESDEDEVEENIENRTEVNSQDTTTGGPQNHLSAHFPSHFHNSVSSLNSAHLSPGIATAKLSHAPKDVSPFGLGIDTHVLSVSPAPGLELKSTLGPDPAVPYTGAGMTQSDTPQAVKGEPTASDASNTNTPVLSLSSSSGVSESSNCLPLILRSVNVHSIPNSFLLNKVPGAWGSVSMATGFDMNVDEEDDDLDPKEPGLFARVKHMDELLEWLVPNLVFDSGLANLERNTQLKLPDFFSEEVLCDATDGNASQETAKAFAATFPMSHVVTLDELLVDTSVQPSVSRPNLDLKSQMPFLDDMALGFSEQGEAARAKRTSVFWDCFCPVGSIDYQAIMSARASAEEKKWNSNAVFALDEVKVKALKNQKEMVNLDFTGTRLWRFLNFDPVNGPKNFQVLMISESSYLPGSAVPPNCESAEFIDLVKYNYTSMRLGEIKKLNLQTFETRPDLEGISNGLISIEKDMGDILYKEFYKRTNRRLKNLAELIKLDLINRTNRFEFDRPLLLLFVNFDESINSILQISKICRNFQVSLKNHQISLVDVFSHVVPASHIIKKAANQWSLKYLSDTKLAKISTLLYNKCPNGGHADPKLITHDNEEPKKLYTQIIEDAPTSLQFKFLNRSGRESLNSESSDDLFLHIAYERSVDRNWICAAWSDPYGIVTHTKTWFCPASTKHSGKDVYDLGSIISGIWDVSNKLFKKLNEETLKSNCGSGKKRFLVLARVSSIIPDDELLHWKRLTAKYKDVSLVVLTTNRTPKYLFESRDDRGGLAGIDGLENSGLGSGHADAGENLENPDFIQAGETLQLTHNSTSPSGSLNMLTSPMNNALSFHSPQQFPNAPTSMFLSDGTRQEMAYDDADYVLRDKTSDIMGIIPRVALPSCNAPTRYSMRTGYLVKKSKVSQKGLRTKQYTVFEVSLLSCSNYWNLDTAMKITLKQYKKLIALNEILGIYDSAPASKDDLTRARETALQTLVPWHINAVVKALDYLVHVHVGE